MPRLPEITELQTFLLATEERSLSRAARRLHLSPAAVAKRLDNLEAVLGYPLLKRGPRGVLMTARGRSFHAQALQVVRGAEGLVERDPADVADRLPGVHRLLGRRTVRSSELLLADVERLLGHLLDSSSAAIVLFRVPDRIVLEANEEFARLVDIPREELLGRPSPGDGSRYDAAFRTLSETGATRRASTVFRTHSGKERAVDVVSRRLEFAGEDVFLLILNDVTRVRERERRLATRIRRQRLISRHGQMISTGVDLEELLGATLELTRAELGFCSIGLLDDSTDGVEPRLVVGPDGGGLVEAAHRHRRTWSRGDVVAEFEGTAPARDYVVCSPLPGRRGTGHVLVGRGLRMCALNEDELDFLRSVTTICAAALTAAGELAA